MKRQTGSEPLQTARLQSPLIYYHSRIIFTEKKNRIPAVFLNQTDFPLDKAFLWGG